MFPNFYYETFQAHRNIENKYAMNTQLDPTVVPFYCMCFITNVSLFPSLYLGGSEPGANLLLGGHLALSGSLFFYCRNLCVWERILLASCNPQDGPPQRSILWPQMLITLKLRNMAVCPFAKIICRHQSSSSYTLHHTHYQLEFVISSMVLSLR